MVNGNWGTLSVQNNWMFANWYAEQKFFCFDTFPPVEGKVRKCGVCVLLCFIKPLLGNRYVRSRGFIVSEPRETHPQSEIADVPTLPCPPLDNLGCSDPHPSPWLRRCLYRSPPLPLRTDPATTTLTTRGLCPGGSVVWAGTKFLGGCSRNLSRTERKTKVVVGTLFFLRRDTSSKSSKFEKKRFHTLLQVSNITCSTLGQDWQISDIATVHTDLPLAEKYQNKRTLVQRTYQLVNIQIFCTR